VDVVVNEEVDLKDQVLQLQKDNTELEYQLNEARQRIAQLSAT
jgi:hypothetical protein